MKYRTEDKKACAEYIASFLTKFKKPNYKHEYITKVLINKLSHKELGEILITLIK